DGYADACVCTRKLFEREDVRDEVRARSAVVLGHSGSHQPELGELREELAWKVVLPVPRRRVRLDLLAREVARERLDLTLLRGELEVHVPSFAESAARLLRGEPNTHARSRACSSQAR